MARSIGSGSISFGQMNTFPHQNRCSTATPRSDSPRPALGRWKARWDPLFGPVRGDSARRLQTASCGRILGAPTADYWPPYPRCVLDRRTYRCLRGRVCTTAARYRTARSTDGGRDYRYPHLAIRSVQATSTRATFEGQESPIRSRERMPAQWPGPDISVWRRSLTTGFSEPVWNRHMRAANHIGRLQHSRPTLACNNPSAGPENGRPAHAQSRH